MKRILAEIFKSPILLVFCSVLIKVPMFFTGNIQEDSFITWRVARNVVKYGVIGFNGQEKISASTTHLYMMISACFNVIFGDHFIYPLLLFSTLLFGIGSYWLAKILFPTEGYNRGLFMLLLNLTPPALTASCLGMEYGILFFLYNALLYFGIYKNRKWAYIIIPILLLWTRIDTVIFLGIVFVVDLYLKRKFNYLLIIGGLIGLLSVIGFNYFYFGELINHTITAKKIAYKNLLQNNSTEFLLYQWAYYGGLIKKYSLITLLVFLSFILFLFFAFYQIARNKNVNSRLGTAVVVFIMVFALLKISVFSYFKAYFDWYYWIPRVFLFAVTLYYLLNFVKWKKAVFVPLLSLVFMGFYSIQWLQSYTIGFMEERQRIQIAEDIAREDSGLNKSILLEPAGIIPFYTNLYTYDEVGLVNARVNTEMLKDENYWWINTVLKYKPNYILTIGKKPGNEKSTYRLRTDDLMEFNGNYTLVKRYSIGRIYQSAPFPLNIIYKIRPIGKDYYLYKRNAY